MDIGGLTLVETLGVGGKDEVDEVDELDGWKVEFHRK